MCIRDRRTGGGSNLSKDNYPSINGSLIFIMISVRPDICMPVGRLSRAMHNPSKRDAVMCVDVLSYVKRTRRMKLVYRRSGNAIEQVYKQLAQATPVRAPPLQSTPPCGCPGAAHARAVPRSTQQTDTPPSPFAEWWLVLFLSVVGFSQRYCFAI